MSIGALDPSRTFGSAYPGIRDRVRKTQSGFADAIGAASKTDEARMEEYLDHLRSKYGAHFRVESIPKDDQALERAGKAMHGDDVVIAPCIVAEMAADPEVGAWYEKAIDDIWASVPAYKAEAAARGLTFEPCGVVVHDDGTVTFICGGGDSPEKVAQVNAINAARDAKRAAQRRAQLEAHIEHTQDIRAAFARRQLASLQSGALQMILSARSGSGAYGNAGAADLGRTGSAPAAPPSSRI